MLHMPVSMGMSLRTVDTDVVVLAVARFQNNYLQLSEFWIEFGSGKHYHFIPAHSVALSMGPERASALAFFMPSQGVIPLQLFVGLEKTAWNAREVFHK